MVRMRRITINKLLIPSRRRKSITGLKIEMGSATSIKTPVVAEGSAKVAHATTNVTAEKASIVRGRIDAERRSPINVEMPQMAIKSSNPIIVRAITDSEPQRVYPAGSTTASKKLNSGHRELSTAEPIYITHRSDGEKCSHNHCNNLSPRESKHKYSYRQQSDKC